MNGKIVFLSFVVALSGCASQQLSMADIGPVKEFQLIFPNDPFSSRPVGYGEVSAAIVDSLKSHTRYPFSERWNGSFYTFHGMYAQILPNNTILVCYGTGDNMSRNQLGYQYSKYQNVVKFFVRVNPVSSNGKVVATIDSSAQIMNGTNALGGKFLPLGSVSELEADLTNALSSKDTVVVQRKVNISGEVNNHYNPDSTYANFLRKLGRYDIRGKESSAIDVRKEVAYNFKVGNVVNPLYVTVYPYRNGSKVEYKSMVSYFLRANNTVSISPYDISNFKKNIEKIAND
jgi:hypothetical protein